MTTLVVNGVFAMNIIVLCVLLLCSALISGAEVAMFGLSTTEIKELQDEKTAKSAILIKLLERPKKLLATILIANNAINIGVVLLFSVIGDTLFENVNQILFGVVSVRFLL
ncbi:MAG TPA: gliding motility-associated protein GldE, partial [Maribacter sp.]|nr:gliding motility-associated protein GldE [Maribacter sp.]